MYEITCDVAIVGGGPAGLAAAAAAKKEGTEKVIIIERDETLGGILQQCIHPGFGLKLFKEELTGPEYYGRFVDKVKELGVETLMNSMVLEIEKNTVVCMNKEHGITNVNTKSIVLAMGCRERTRANIMIPGTRPAGIYTAGSAQRLMNRQNEMVGKKVVILGSGDIGMIMARRMTLEGAEVVAVVELNNFLAGLTRNKVQCLDDFGIPLLLSHTITNIKGNDRVEGVVVSKVDEATKKVIAGSEQFFECDTLLLSVGLIPENELTRKAEIEISSITNGPVVNQYMQTSIPSVFACGNVVHVNDLVDNVSTESAIAGASAAKFAKGELGGGEEISVKTGENVRYVCPQRVVGGGGKVDFYFRVMAPKGQSVIAAKDGDKVLCSRKTIKVNPGEIEKITVDLGGVREIVIESREA
ncbi:MAG: FAD-dependent oxidoreductase [Clostridia bacterium]|nr:FAD-dependent oxidoreductase [Clostridia bacterium]